MTVFAIILFVLGSFITIQNVYWTFIRFPLHLATGGTRENYRYTSATPLIGSGMLWLCVWAMPARHLIWVPIAVSLFDTGGIHWAIAMLLGWGMMSFIKRRPRA